MNFEVSTIVALGGGYLALLFGIAFVTERGWIWINQSTGDWYRPFFVGFIVILVASWSHREQDSDEF